MEDCLSMTNHLRQEDHMVPSICHCWHYTILIGQLKEMLICQGLRAYSMNLQGAGVTYAECIITFGNLLEILTRACIVKPAQETTWSDRPPFYEI